jgi:acyl-CoA synthetase (AMP-forming)/AMP-acid ligase II
VGLGWRRGAPNFAYDLSVRKTTPEQRQKLDLSQWKVAFNGAEPVRLDTLERFAAAFEPSGFRREAFLPCYGLAEITVGVCWAASATLPVVYPVKEAALADNKVVAASPDAPGSKLLVGCGQAPMNQTIRIVDPDRMTLSAPHQIGEIWLSGASVTQGYWNQPEKTAQLFDAYLADSGEGPFLRTGDMGFLVEGELFVTGRIKDLIIIRGQNYYPQDIEATVEQATFSVRVSFASLLRPGCVAAFSIERDGQERLVIVGEVSKSVQPPLAAQIDDAVKAIRRAVSEQYGLKVYAISLLKTRSIPKTSSGKIRRHACKNGFLDGRLQTVAKWSMEKRPSPPQPF